MSAEARPPDDVARATEKMFSKMDAEDKATFNWWVKSARAAASQGAPPSGLTPPSGAATAEYSAEEISRLASIRERLAKRTPGEWSIYRGEESAVGVGSMATRQIVCRTAPPFTTLTPADIDANTDFIAHAPDDLAWLIELVERHVH